MIWLVVALGSALGGMARFGVGILAARALGVWFPWGTLLINIVGSFVIGLFAALPASVLLRAFVMVGICGGFTTFSSFSLQTVELLQADATGRAAGYVVASVALCVAGAAFGYWLALRLGLPERGGA